MDYDKPTLFLLSGPPGAGKSTFGKLLLPEHLQRNLTHFNRDLAGMAAEKEMREKGIPVQEAKLKSVSVMETKLDQLMKTAIGEKAHFALETPLSHPMYWDYMTPFLLQGYQVQLDYVCLDTIAQCQTRVMHRQENGGLVLPPSIVAGVFKSNLSFLDEAYHLIDKLNLYDNTTKPLLLASFENGKLIKAESEALKKEWINEGLPDAALRIKKQLAETQQQNKGMKM